MDNLLAGTRPGEYYFIINEALFNSIVANSNAILYPPNRAIILGRIGQTADGDFKAFIYPASCTFISPGTLGTRGTGATSGAKIPSDGGGDQ